jgi:uncharacterized protein (TIGR01777 family)
MRFVIAGGTGFIGSALVKELVKDDHEVIIFTRTPEKHKFDTNQKIKFIGWEPKPWGEWAKWVDGAYGVVNLAGESIAGNSLWNLIIHRWTKSYKNLIISSRLNAGEALTWAIEGAKTKPEVLIQASAVGYYGDRGEEDLDIDSGPGDDYTSKVCQQWEASTQGVEALGVRRVIIRTGGIVMSAHGGVLPFMMLPYKFFLGGPLGGGRHWVSWIHVADEINAIKYLALNPVSSGPYNLCAPQIFRNKDFSKILGKVMKRPSFFPMPAFALRLLFGEKSTVILSSQKQNASKLLSQGYQFLFPELEPALRNILA